MMDYAGVAQRGLPIGSRVVEAACMALVTERMNGPHAMARGRWAYRS